MKVEDAFALMRLESKNYFDIENIKCRMYQPPDVNAFVLINNILPSDKNIILSVGPNEIVLNADAELLCQLAYDDELVDLVRCGVTMELRNNEYILVMRY